MNPPSGLWHLSSEPITKHSLLTRLATRIGWKYPIGENTTTNCDRALDGSRLREYLEIPCWNVMLDGPAKEILERNLAK